MQLLTDPALVDWSRAQFALTAMYHWLFVPLTLGITFIIAIMETMYVTSGNKEWKRITKFWMKLFGINFAIGVATGIILEFEFGTNWSNYSWFVGDIFGAPLAIEGIMAFFMESTFIAVMFFGWDRVSKRFHLVSTWLTALGANLSALWILVANGWMQNPVGMSFNPDTARNEMVNFWDVALSSTAVTKFLHTITSSFVVASIFVIGISAWFILKNRDIIFAKKSIIVASIFGLFGLLMAVGTGDGSARNVAEDQPMKFAAMEGLYEGGDDIGIVAFGVLEPGSETYDFLAKIEIPGVLSMMTKDGYVPGIKDLIDGDRERGLLSADEKISKGKIAIQSLKSYKEIKNSYNKSLASGDMQQAQELEKEMTLHRNQFMSKEFQEDYFQYFGYGYINDTKELIPNVPLTFYSFHIMVVLSCIFVIVLALSLFFSIKNKITKHKWLLKLSIISMPLVYSASMAGWIVAEVGRQPWVIQDLMPASAAVTNIGTESVITTFWLFAALFTALLIAEVRIMLKQIKVGPNKVEE